MARRAVAVIGTGTIGRSWIRVFTRGGYPTRVWDPDPEQVQKAWAWLKLDLKLHRKRQGLRKAVARAQRELVTKCETLEEALDGVAYAQENAPEDLATKQQVWATLDAAADPATILASSSGSWPLEQLAGGLAGRHRWIIVHPQNDPHTFPAVEVCADDQTNPAVVRRTMRFLRDVGLHPLRVQTHRTGLVAARLEAALLREAIGLLLEGAADADTIDGVVTQGLGQAWGIQGPLRSLALKADGGLREHLTRYAGELERIWLDADGDVKLTPELIDRIASQVVPPDPGLDHVTWRAWRDDLVERHQNIRANHPADEAVAE